MTRKIFCAIKQLLLFITLSIVIRAILGPLIISWFGNLSALIISCLVATIAVFLLWHRSIANVNQNQKIIYLDKVCWENIEKIVGVRNDDEITIYTKNGSCIKEKVSATTLLYGKEWHGLNDVRLETQQRINMSRFSNFKDIKVFFARGTTRRRIFRMWPLMMESILGLFLLLLGIALLYKNFDFISLLFIVGGIFFAKNFIEDFRMGWFMFRFGAKTIREDLTLYLNDDGITYQLNEKITYIAWLDIDSMAICMDISLIDLGLMILDTVESGKITVPYISEKIKDRIIEAAGLNLKSTNNFYAIYSK